MTTATSAAVTPERIYQFAWAFAQPLILETAIRHRIFDELDSGPMSLPEIQEATETSERGLAAILNALVGFGFLAKDSQGDYSLTPESAAFLVSSKPSFQGGFVRHTSEHLLPRWMRLHEIVASGQPALANDQQDQGAEFFRNFVSDLFPMNYPAAQALAAHLDLKPDGNAPSILDLAAGSGVWGIALAQSCDTARVTALDWPEVLSITRDTASRHGVGDRFTYVEGDLRSADFGAGYDVAVLGHIVHTMGVDSSRELIGKTFNALASGGTIAIAEFLVDADRSGPLNGLIFAINMLVNTEDGNTYSFEEISEWLEDAGFTNPRALPVQGPSPLILATKP